MTAGTEGARSGRRRSKAVALPGIMPVVATRISDSVADQIRALIASEDLDEGARLPSERELAVLLGTSRPTVSQALRHLSLMGMVEIRRGSGAYVMRKPLQMVTASVGLMLDLNRGSITELAQIRLWLETVGVDRAARRPDPFPRVEADALRSALHRLREASGVASQWIAADTVFHAAVVAAAGNAYLAGIYESVHTALLTFEYEQWVRDEVEPPWLEHSDASSQWTLHEPILAAVLARKPGVARAAVLRHHEAMMAHLATALA